MKSTCGAMSHSVQYLEHSLTTFLAPRHPLEIKKFGKTLTCHKMRHLSSQIGKRTEKSMVGGTRNFFTTPWLGITFLEQWFSTISSWRPIKQNNTQFGDPFITFIVLKHRFWRPKSKCLRSKNGYTDLESTYLSLALAAALRFCEPTGRYESRLTQQ